jgi:hypothetical protein
MVETVAGVRGAGAADPVPVALGAIGAAHVGALALTESYRTLPAVLVAYAAAWWVVRPGREAAGDTPGNTPGDTAGETASDRRGPG